MKLSPNQFTVKPNHWWQYLTPSYWKNKRTIEVYIHNKIADYLLEEMGIHIKNSLLYGESVCDPMKRIREHEKK